MKGLFVFACLCLLFSVGSSAQQTGPDAQASKEDVESYLQLVHSSEMFTKMIDAMSKPLHKMLQDEYLKDKDKLPPDFEPRMNKELDDLLKNMPIEEMTQAMVPTYQKHFTKGDLEAMKAFFASPTGQKVLNEMPAIMAESMQDTMPIMKKYLDNVQQRMEKEVAQMKQQAPAP